MILYWDLFTCMGFILQLLTVVNVNENINIVLFLCYKDDLRNSLHRFGREILRYGFLEFRQFSVTMNASDIQETFERCFVLAKWIFQVPVVNIYQMSVCVWSCWGYFHSSQRQNYLSSQKIYQKILLFWKMN